MEVIIMMKATRTSNNDLHRLAAQLGYTESEAEVEKEFLCEM